MKTYARFMNAIYMLTKEMEALKLNVDRIKKNAKPKRAQILPILPSTNPALINIWTIIPAWNCGSKVGNLLGNVTPSLAIKIACSMHKIQIRLLFSVSFASFPSYVANFLISLLIPLHHLGYQFPGRRKLSLGDNQSDHEIFSN